MQTAGWTLMPTKISVSVNFEGLSKNFVKLLKTCTEQCFVCFVGITCILHLEKDVVTATFYLKLLYFTVCFGLGLDHGPLQYDTVIDASNLHHFDKNCTIIEGSIFINLGTFLG